MREDKREDIFDIDMKVTKAKNDGGAQPQITSKFLCTPTCGNTGSGNSFCC